MLCVACAWSKRGGMSRFSFDRKQRAQRSRASAERTRLASAPPPPEPQPLRSAHGSAPPRGCRRGTGGGAGVGGSDQTQSRECRASGISRVTRDGRRARRPLTLLSGLCAHTRLETAEQTGERSPDRGRGTSHERAATRVPRRSPVTQRERLRRERSLERKNDALNNTRLSRRHSVTVTRARQSRNATVKTTPRRGPSRVPQVPSRDGPLSLPGPGPRTARRTSFLLALAARQ